MRLSTLQMSSAGVREILARQSEVQHTQLQLSTQKRVLKPSDDPVAATSISFLQAEISQLEQFNRNSDAAKANNNLEETVLNSTTNILFRVEELIISLGNGSYGAPEYNAVKVELNERLQELKGLGNTQNANGDYIFSGSVVKTEPFTQDNTGVFSYNGDQDQRMLRISSGVMVPVSDSGFDAFVDVKNGNGKFTTTANVGNTGSGIISPGSYNAPPQFLAESYDITFALNGLGELEYTATGQTSGLIVDGPSLYQDGAAINFNGIQFDILGSPQAGDSFSIDASSSQDLFTTLQNIINTIDNFDDSPVGRAEMINNISSQQVTLNNHMQNIDTVRAKIGSRLNVIDSEFGSNLSLLVTSATALSDVQDLDVVEAATRLSQQVSVLEAAQTSFVRVQNLSLFNFL